MQGRGAGEGVRCTSGRWGILPILYSPCFPSSSRVGRTSFYEEYGVIRDVLQNHLTEVLTLVAMELPSNVSSPEAVLQRKLQAFRALRGLQKGSAVLGQYQAYGEQVRREQQKPDSFHSLTPTFAGGPWGRAGAAPHRKQLSKSRRPLVWVGRDLRWDIHKGARRQGGRSFASLAFHCLWKLTRWVVLGEGYPNGGLSSVRIHTHFQSSLSRIHTWLPPIATPTPPAPSEATDLSGHSPGHLRQAVSLQLRQMSSQAMLWTVPRAQSVPGEGRPPKAAGNKFHYKSSGCLWGTCDVLGT